MRPLDVDTGYLLDRLRELLAIPSPSGYTDNAVHYVCSELTRLGIGHEVTRRGAIRANLPGTTTSPDRALVAHLDTLGAMVRGLKDNGRLAVTPIGTWSARFAEGARVSVLGSRGQHRGTILPLKASGHVFGEEVDGQPVAWSNLEIRVDERVEDGEQLRSLGIEVGDYVAVDPQPEVTDTGFVVARHLDDKAGAACLFAAARAVVDAGVTLPLDCHLLFTIFEEVGSGASAVLHQDVAEMVAVDNAAPAPGQTSTETGVTIAAKDLSGPFDFHLTRHLLDLARDHGISVVRDVFPNYRCDAASAVEAGNDIRTALVCFGVDASHGYERTHLQGLEQLARLLTLYVQSPPAVPRDRMELGPPKGLPEQPG